jgi:hypothetical protein
MLGDLALSGVRANSAPNPNGRLEARLIDKP